MQSGRFDVRESIVACGRIAALARID